MKYVKIITDEQRMLRMLYLELANYGFEVISTLDTPSITSDDEMYILADLDRIAISQIDAHNAKLIGYSRKSRDESDINGITTLHRPFRIAELVSLLGGSLPVRTPTQLTKPTEKPITTNTLIIDTATKSAQYGDVKISFSDNEFKVLHELYQNKGDIVSRESIAALLGVTEGNMGDVYVCHLRRKIDNKLGLKLIYTIRGKGYILKI